VELLVLTAASGATSVEGIVDLPADTGYREVSVVMSCPAGCSGASFYVEPLLTRYRVTQKQLSDGLGNPAQVYTYTYTYSGAATNDPAHSAIVATTTNYCTDSNHDNDLCYSPAYTEFRGHSSVTEIGPDGRSTTTWFHQDDERVGQAYQTEIKKGGSLYLSNETLYTSTNAGVTTVYPKKDGADYKMVPIHWVAVTWQKSFTYEGGPAPVGTMVKNYYDVARQGGITQYGNLTRTEELSFNGTSFDLYRGSETLYYPFTSTTQFLVGLPGETKQFSCPLAGCNLSDNAALLADAQYLYDGSSSPGTPPTVGKLTGERHLLRWTDPVNKTGPLYSDVDYAYDAWGNRVSVTQYTLEGTQSALAKNLANNGLQRTITCYGVTDTPVGCVDDGYHTYPLWQKNALDQGTGYVYNYALGLPTQVTGPNSAATTAAYDPYGRLWKIARPGDDLNSPTIELSYHDATATTPFWTQATQKLDGGLSFSVRKFYNGLGELIQTQQVGVNVSDVNVACIATTCTVVSNQKAEYVDGVKTTTQAMPYAVATPAQAGYIALSASSWQNATVTTYDILGRPLVSKAPGQTEANNQHFSYGVDGNRLKTTTTDPNGHTTESWQDVWGRTVKVKPQIGPWLEYGYDVANRLTTVKQFPQGGSAEFATTTINYDVAGRKTSMVDPDMGAWSYAYDALSNLTRQADAKNQRICLYYDGLNRVTGKHYRTDDTCPTANPTLNVSYSYDATSLGIGRRTGMADVSGSTAWSYDNRGRMTSEAKTITGAGTYTTAWTYTNTDQVKTMIYPKGSQTATSEIVTSNYLPQGTLTSLTSSFGSTYLTSAAVDAAGRATVFNLGNGTQTIYTYNTWAETDGKQSGRLKKLQSGTPESLTAGAPSLQSFEYAYDWAGNITDITQKVGSQSVETPHYDYDEINRLTSVTYGGNPTTTTYDANTGNLATKASKALGYGTQAANCPGGALTKVHAAISLDSTTNTYCYDANGNMTRRTIGASIYNLSYDPENRLTQISGGGGPVFDYVYDGDGQRVMVKQTTGTQTDKTIYIGGYFEVFIKASYTAPATPPARNCGTMRCIFLPLVTTLFTSPAPAGQVWKSYYSTGSGRALRVQDNTNTGGVSGIFWLYADHLGSTTVTARMDGLGGDLISTLSYTAWGETRASSGATPTSIRYTGQREAEAGLYFYQARWYDPYLNRWTQPDSIVPDPGNPLSYDRYAYVHNNPVNFNDPTGHYACGDGIDNPRCEQDSPSYSMPFTPTWIIDQFGGIGGNSASALNIADAWFNAHPDYDIFNDTSIWVVYNGQVVYRGEYEQLVQAYYMWRASRGEQALILLQGNAQMDRFIRTGDPFLRIWYPAVTVVGGGKGAVVCLAGASSTVAGNESSGLSRSWSFGAFKSQTKWQNQMNKRGWTNTQISEALESDQSYPAYNYVNKGNPATRYVHPITGRSLVIDDITNELLHIGGNNYDYD
jgi:RHS repeat-associated protein